jgi:hypothetical protein
VIPGPRFKVKDSRDQKFKNERCFRYDWNGVSRSFTCGDQHYDRSIAVLFEQMMVARFGNNADGPLVELGLKSFFNTSHLNDLIAVPFVGFLAIAADVEMNASLSVDVSVLASDGKYAFRKQYDIIRHEMKAHDDKEMITNMYIDAFNQFADEFALDFGRIRF